MTEYRQKAGRDVWHFHRGCQHWLWWHGIRVDGDKVRQTKPKSGELCNECRGKAKRDAR